MKFLLPVNTPELCHKITIEQNDRTFDVCIATHKNKREDNEDNAGVWLSDNIIWAAVADGLGGHVNGELASSTVVQRLQELTTEAAPDAENFETSIKQILSTISQELQLTDLREGDTRPRLSDMLYGPKPRDTTVAVAAIFPDAIRIAIVGDSTVKSLISSIRTTVAQGEGCWVGHTVRELQVDNIDFYTWDRHPKKLLHLYLHTDGCDEVYLEDVGMVDGWLDTADNLIVKAMAHASDNTTAITIVERLSEQAVLQ